MLLAGLRATCDDVSSEVKHLSYDTSPLTSSEAICLSASAVAFPAMGSLWTYLTCYLMTTSTKIQTQLCIALKNVSDLCFVRVLWSRKMLKIVRRLDAMSMVKCTTNPNVVVNGVFGAPKPGGAQRFIVYCRPVNQLFSDLLALPPLLTAIDFFLLKS
jgi:hypothetical protein